MWRGNFYPLKNGCIDEALIQSVYPVMLDQGAERKERDFATIA
jgi:hypothetical protein